MMQKLVDQMSSDGARNYWRSTFNKWLSDEVIDLIEHGHRMESRLSRIVIQFFGGAVGRVGPADTAFAQRQAQYNIGIETQRIAMQPKAKSTSAAHAPCRMR